MHNLISFIRIIFASSLCLYASYTDLKYNQIEHFTWIIGVIGGLLLLLFDSPKPNILALTVGIGILFSLVLYHFGGLGGGDTKMIWAIAVLLPVHPEIYGLPLVSSGLIGFPFTLVVNWIAVFGIFALILTVIVRLKRIKFNVWNHKYPQMPFITAGFFISLIFGDLFVSPWLGGLA